MTRCASCNGTLSKDETSCFLCGTPVPVEHAKASLQERFRTAVKVAFIGSSALTVASLFVPYTPSFIKCMVMTLVLLLVKSSADQMFESQ